MANDYWGSLGVPEPPPGLTKGQRKRWRHQYLEKLKKGSVAANAVPSSSATTSAIGASGAVSAATQQNGSSLTQQNGQSGSTSASKSHAAGKSTPHKTAVRQTSAAPVAQRKIKTGRVEKSAQGTSSQGSSDRGPRSLAQLEALRAAQLKAASTTRLCRPPMKQWLNADGTPYETPSSVAEEGEAIDGAEDESSVPSALGRWQGGSGGLALKQHPSASSSHSSLKESSSLQPPTRSGRNLQPGGRVIYPPAGERRLSSIPDRPFIDPQASLQHLRDIQEGRDDDDDSSDKDSSDSDDELPAKPAANGSIAECFAEQIRGNSPAPSPGDQLRATLHDNIVLSQSRSMAAAEQSVPISADELPTVGHPLPATEELAEVVDDETAVKQRQVKRAGLRLNDVTDQYPEETVHLASSSPNHPAIASSVLDYDEPMDYVYNAVEDVTYGILTTTRALPSSKPPSERDLHEDPVLTSHPRNSVFTLGTAAIESTGTKGMTDESGLQLEDKSVGSPNKRAAEDIAAEAYDEDSFVVRSQSQPKWAAEEERTVGRVEGQSAKNDAQDAIEEDDIIRSSPPIQGSAVHKSVQKYFTGPSRRAAGIKPDSSQISRASTFESLPESVDKILPPAEDESPQDVVSVVADDPTPAKKRKMTGMTSKHFSVPKRSKRKSATEVVEAAGEQGSNEVNHFAADVVEERNYPNRRTRSMRRVSSPLKQIVDIEETGEGKESSEERDFRTAGAVNDGEDSVITVASQSVSTPIAKAPNKRATRKSKATSEAVQSSPDVRTNKKAEVSAAAVREAADGSELATPKKTPVTRKKLKSTGAVSPHFITDRVDLYNTTLGGKRVPAGTSRVPVPPISESAFGIIQEKLWHDPFWLLIAVTFLNKTTGRAAVPIFWKLKKTYPTPTELAAADQPELMLMVHSLGLQNARSKRLIKMAQAWLDSPPVAGKRYRTLNYPNKGDGKASTTANVIEEDADDCSGALEIGHIPGCRDYAWDSWRIFCRDVLRGVAEDYNGKGATVDDFVPEWKSVVPGDKELRACLRWMWLREGWIWNHETGDKRRATDEEMEQARQGQMKFDDPQEMKFAAQAAGVEVSPIKPEDKAGELDAPFDNEDLDNIDGKSATPTTQHKTTDENADISVVDNGLRRWPTGSSSGSSLTTISDDNIIVAPVKTPIEYIPSKRTRGTPTLANQKLIRPERAKAKRRAAKAQIAALEEEKARIAEKEVVQKGPILDDNDDNPVDEGKEKVIEKKATRSGSRKQKSLPEKSTPAEAKKRARSGSATAKENAKLLAKAAEFVHGPKGARRRSARVSMH